MTTHSQNSMQNLKLMKTLTTSKRSFLAKFQKLKTFNANNIKKPPGSLHIILGNFIHHFLNFMILIEPVCFH